MIVMGCSMSDVRRATAECNTLYYQAWIVFCFILLLHLLFETGEWVEKSSWFIQGVTQFR